jgi:uncharacterized protein
MPRPLVAPTPAVAATFVALAIGWTWSFGFLAAVVPGPTGRVLHLLALPGPLIAWVLVLATRCDARYRRQFVTRVFDPRRVRPRIWLALVLVGAGPAALAWLVAPGAGRSALEPGLTAWSVAAVLGFALAAGAVEEPGWRGLAQDGLAPRIGALSGALVLGVLWSLWHLPLYFIEGTYQHQLGAWTVAFWVSC